MAPDKLSVDVPPETASGAAALVAPVVCKYGGSSLASADKIAAVADAVAARVRAGTPVVVVCSAMGATTDALLAQARALTPTPAARELDMLVTCGERAAVALLAIALRARGVAAQSLTGSQAGIITDERHQAARIVAVRPARVAQALAAGSQVVVVAGYQGVSRTREVTTLGRGGSDVTAVALGAALGAAQVAIYSDVDGIYDADPRRVLQARHLPALDYAQMHRLALGGAKVLHPEAVRLAELLGIEVVAAAGHAPGGRHTRLRPPLAAPAAGERAYAVRAPAAVAVQRHALLLQGAAALPRAEALTAADATLCAAAQGGAVVAFWSAAARDAALAPASAAAAAGATARPVAWLSVTGADVGPKDLAAAEQALARAPAPSLWSLATFRLLGLAVATDADPDAARAGETALHAAFCRPVS